MKRHFIRFLFLLGISSTFLIYSCKSTKQPVTEIDSLSANEIDEKDSTYLAIYNQRQKAYEEQDGFGFAAERPQLDAAQEATKYSLVPIFYATDRQKKNSKKPSKIYSGKKGDGELHLGKCIVSIPRIHSMGEIERPLWWKLEFSENPEKQIILKEVQQLSDSSFFKQLEEKTIAADRREAFVYIHGFNTSFSEAVLRAAQMAYDISFSGVPIVYSWPSKGKVLEYWEDGKNSEWTVPHLEDFLEQLVTKESFDQIHIIAHSMGNRPMTKALMTLAKRHKEEAIFEQVILAAPDIDAEIFVNDIAPNISQVANNVTLYASSKDKALQVSRSINKGHRAGEGGERLTVINGIQTVEASSIDMDFLGHNYYANTWIMLNDLYHLVNEGMEADLRDLNKQYKSTLEFWTF